MRILKLTVLSLLVLTFTQFKTSAQHELKTNAIGLIVGSYGLQYEYVTEEMGFLLGVTYFNSGSLLGGDLNTYSSIAITPEFRYYFNPDEDASGFFASAYLRYRSATGEDWYTWTDDNGNLVMSDLKNSGMALGFSTGYKWVTRSGLVFETFFGLGRYLFDNYSYDPEIDDELLDVVDDLPSFDVRFGFAVGYRFGH